MFCLGCHCDTLSGKMCGGCERRKCDIEKSYRNCAKCDSFPCNILKKYLGYSSNSFSFVKT